MADKLHPYRSWLAPVPPLDAERVWQRVEARAQLGRRWFVLAPALAAVVVIAFAAGYVLMREERSGALLLADGSAPATLASEVGAKTVALSDGSHIELQEHSQLQTRVSTGSSFEAELTRGRAVFDVVPHGPRVWSVRAGDVQVRVLGTRFSVALEGTFVRVAVERGRVQVQSPLLGGTRILQANESLQLPAAAAKRAPSEPARTLEPTAAAAGSGDAVEPAATASRPTRRKRAASLKIRDNDNAGSIEELLQRADAARKAGQPGKAASALERAVSDYPGDARAGLAAFTLAQLYMEQLAQPREAAKTFERATALGLPAALDEDAMARRVQAYVHAGEREQAHKAADAYQHKYPSGARRAAVARWLAELK